MGYVLVKEKDRQKDIYFNSSAWAMMLRIALDNGWEPLGSIEPYWGRQDADHGNVQGKWDGNYVTNDYQRVTEEDSKAFCIALRRGLAKLRASLEKETCEDKETTKNRIELIEEFLQCCQGESFRIY